MSAFLTIVTSEIPKRLTKKWSIDAGGQAIKEGGGRASCWLETTIDAWLQERASGGKV